MKFRGIITAFLLLLPASSFGASKETQELQRDVALMQEDIRQLQRSFDQQITKLLTLVQQSVDNSSRNQTSVGVLSQTLPDQIKREMGNSLAPVVGLSTKLDQVTAQVQTLSDAVQALNASMQQLHTQMTDLKNVIAAMQAPAPAPPPPTDPNSGSSTTIGAGPSSSMPPVPAEVLYQNALRDMNGGKPDLALAEYRDFIKYYPTSDLASNSQYYIGVIHYSRNEFEDAVRDFDAVLERYPKGNKTADAFYYKGVSLVKMGRSRDARKEFATVIQQFPHSEAADKAKSQMKALGFNSPAKARQ